MEIPKRTTVQQLMRRAMRGQSEIKAIRAEYAELRKIANKRIKRAQEKGDLLDVEQFQTTKSIMNAADSTVNLIKAHHEVVNFLNSKRSTAKGREEIRQKTLETYESIGYKGVILENDRMFSEFMEQWRIRYEQDTTIGKKLFSDSDKAAEFFDAHFERISDNDKDTNAVKIRRIFDRWLKSQQRSTKRREKKAKQKKGKQK